MASATSLRRRADGMARRADHERHGWPQSSGYRCAPKEITASCFSTLLWGLLCSRSPWSCLAILLLAGNSESKEAENQECETYLSLWSGSGYSQPLSRPEMDHERSISPQLSSLVHRWGYAAREQWKRCLLQNACEDRAQMMWYFSCSWGVTRLARLITRVYPL